MDRNSRSNVARRCFIVKNRCCNSKSSSTLSETALAIVITSAPTGSTFNAIPMSTNSSSADKAPSSNVPCVIPIASSLFRSSAACSMYFSAMASCAAINAFFSFVRCMDVRLSACRYANVSSFRSKGGTRLGKKTRASHLSTCCCQSSCTGYHEWILGSISLLGRRSGPLRRGRRAARRSSRRSLA